MAGIFMLKYEFVKLNIFLESGYLRLRCLARQ